VPSGAALANHLLKAATAAIFVRTFRIGIRADKKALSYKKPNRLSPNALIRAGG
jgi:hypothetical protein